MSILNKKNYSLLFRYGISIVTVILALILTHLLSPLRNQTPFPFFFAAVIFSAWYGGLVPGLINTGLSALAISYFFLPLYDPFGSGLGNLVRSVTFVVVSMLICLFDSARKRAEETNIKLIREQAARTEAEASMQQITRLYRQVEDANRALEWRIKELDDFTHVVSHDLKEPLRGIEAFSGFLLEDYSGILDDQGKRYLNFLKESAVRMKDLIHDLLTLASISQKAATIKEVDLNQILKKVESDLSFSIEQKAAEIRIESPLPTVNCDRVQISEVFKNIISNAIKFNTAVHPVVDIRVHEEADFYLFSVRDNGIGIDPRYTDRIFQLFERLHPREEFPGTGAGLAICKKIIGGLGGRIWVESFSGDGSTFFFTIPIRVGKGDNL